MTEFAHCVRVDVPVAVAYGRWSKLEELPRFMQGVREVRQVTDTHSWSRPEEQAAAGRVSRHGAYPATVS